VVPLPPQAQPRGAPFAFVLAALNSLSRACFGFGLRADACAGCAQVVATWAAELARAAPARKLAFVFLANDVTQHSRRRGTEFADAFAKALPGALRHVSKHSGLEAVRALRRLVAVWEERRVFGAGRTISEFKAAVEEGSAAAGHAATSAGGASAPDARAEEAGDGGALRGALAAVAAQAEALAAAQAAAAAATSDAAAAAGAGDAAGALAAAEAAAAAQAGVTRAHARLSAALRAALATQVRPPIPSGAAHCTGRAQAEEIGGAGLNSALSMI